MDAAPTSNLTDSSLQRKDDSADDGELIPGRPSTPEVKSFAVPSHEDTSGMWRRRQPEAMNNAQPQANEKIALPYSEPRTSINITGRSKPGSQCLNPGLCSYNSRSSGYGTLTRGGVILRDEEEGLFVKIPVVDGNEHLDTQKATIMRVVEGWRQRCGTLRATVFEELTERNVDDLWNQQIGSERRLVVKCHD